MDRRRRVRYFSFALMACRDLTFRTEVNRTTGNGGTRNVAVAVMYLRLSP